MSNQTIESSPERHSAPIAARGPMEHTVKSWPNLFEATLSGLKTHEVRRVSDRDYRVGDRLRLQEFDPVTSNYSGRELVVRITYVTSSEIPCALFRGLSAYRFLHTQYC